MIAICIVCGCRPPAPAGEPAADDAKSGPVTVEFAKVTLQLMETRLEAPGVLTPSQGAIAHVAPAAPGRIVKVLVKEGDRVRAGDLIAVIDNRPQQAAAQSAKSALSSSEALASEAALAARAAAEDQQAAVHVAMLALDAARLDRDGAVHAAQNSLLAAQTDLKKAQNGYRPQELAQFDQAVQQAKFTRDRALAALNRTKILLEGGVAPQKQLEEDQTAFNVADSAYISAKAQDNLAHAGTRPEDLQAAQIKVDGATEALRQAEADGNAHVAQAQAGLSQARQQQVAVAAKRQDAVAQANTARQKAADLAAAQAAAGYAEVDAPLSGIVVRRMLNPGDMADVTTPIADVSHTGSLDLASGLPAEDAARLHSGMSASITSPDLPGRKLSGVVLSVGQVDPATNLLGVRIALQSAPASLHSGSYATASIVIASNPSAMVVPKGAVVTRENRSVVYTVGADSVAHEAVVELGPEHDGVVAILRGLHAGDRVVTLGSHEVADGSKVQEAEKTDEGKGDEAKPGGSNEKPGAPGDKPGADNGSGSS